MLEQSKNIVMPRSAYTHSRSYFKLHGFSDASNMGLCAAIYVVETSILSLFHNIYSLQHPLATISPKGQSIPSWNRQLLLCWESWKHTLILGKISNQIMPLLGQQRRRIYWLLTKSSWTFYVRKSNHATAGSTALPYYIGYLPRVHGLFISENR